MLHSSLNPAGHTHVADSVSSSASSADESENIYEKLNTALKLASGELRPYKELFTRWLDEPKYSPLFLALWSPEAEECAPPVECAVKPSSFSRSDDLRLEAQSSAARTAETQHESRGPFHLVKVMSRFCGWQLSAATPFAPTAPDTDLARELQRYEIVMIHEATLKLMLWAGDTLRNGADNGRPENTSGNDLEKNRAG
jgi:hypothetical protein